MRVYEGEGSLSYHDPMPDRNEGVKNYNDNHSNNRSVCMYMYVNLNSNVRRDCCLML